MEDIKSLELEELILQIENIGEKKFRAKQIYEWLHKKLCDNFDEMTNISKDLKQKLKENFEIHSVELVDKLVSKNDETSKFLFKLYDGNIIESVLMKYKHGNSVCISSQAGCRMGCKFCASTLDGLARNLFVSEMLSQIYYIQKYSGEKVSNVVVMGSGEPFDNYENLLKFINIITSDDGLNISARNITVSTCGIVEKIKELADKKLQLTLAISLHAPNDEIRKKIMPIANKYSIDEILNACKYYFDTTKRRITFEYSLIKGVNDSEENAIQLGKKLKGMNCHVNLIPVNSIKERDFTHSNIKYIQNFKNILEKFKINATIRREMGADIDAACGQLRKKYLYNKEERKTI